MSFPPASLTARSRRILIAGGGVAALETLLALRELAGHRVELTLLSPDREFLYRPATVGEAYDRSQARSYGLGEILGDRPVDTFIWSALGRVYVDEHIAVTTEGALVPYDSLVLAVGAVAVSPFPGALTFRGREDVPALRALVDSVIAGRARSLAISIPSERVWPLPGYELAMMSAARLRERGCQAEVTLVTPEPRPLALFGPAAAAALEPLLRTRGVTLRTSARPLLVRPGRLVLADGDDVQADVVVTLPALEGPRLAGVPFDEHGFIPVDPFGRVKACDDVYAAGDATSYPLKQGGLAAQQADAVAHALAAQAGAPVRPAPFRPILRGLLMTGGAPLYLRSEPDRLRPAAGLSLRAGDAGAPARAHDEDVDRDVSAAAGQPLWWPPSKIAGRYLAPFLATARHRPVVAALLTDREPVDGDAGQVDEVQNALDLALTLADCDANWGDIGSALEALDAAEALAGALPPEYEAKRRQWTAARRRS